MTHIYLAYPGGGAPVRIFRGYDWPVPVNMLVALPYLRGYVAAAREYCYRPQRLMLDSGAFSAWNSGDAIDLDALVRESKNPKWTESVSLDVIGDWRGSQANAIRMRVLGSPAMPVFHVGDPWDLLDFYCKHWPKVGLGGMVGRPAVESASWLEGVFSRAWPHRFHAFGQTSPFLLRRFPCHSADSSSWQQGPMAFGSGFRIRGGRLPRVWGTKTETIVQSIRYAIEYYADLSQQLRQQWCGELTLIGDGA